MILWLQNDFAPKGPKGAPAETLNFASYLACFPKVRFVSLLACVATSCCCYAEEPAENGLYANLKLDRIIGIRILRLPEGDHSSPEARTFVSHDAKQIEAIDDNLRKLPASGTELLSSDTRAKADVRRIVLVNSDGREVSVMIHGDQLFGTSTNEVRAFKNKAFAGSVVAAIKQIERDSERELANVGPLPVIEAVVTSCDAGRFPNAGAGSILVGDRVQIDLAALTKQKSSTPTLQFSSREEPQRKGWLTIPSAMSCKHVCINSNGQRVNVGYRLLAQHYNADAVFRIDVLRMKQRYEISIIHEENTFMRGVVRLTGRMQASSKGKVID